eukprot:m.215650 g.215650  ORF g.215650 m.215650 type:complete len:317 (+) comp22205_c16_seq1:1195-2145(+)
MFWSSSMSMSSSARRYPWITTMGCAFCSMNSDAAARNSPARMMTEVVPSPTSSSCVREISIMDLAAGCCTVISRKMALPSLVITMVPIGSISIFSMARGPRHVRITSATVLAAMMFSSWMRRPSSFFVWVFNTRIWPGAGACMVALCTFLSSAGSSPLAGFSYPRAHKGEVCGKAEVTVFSHTQTHKRDTHADAFFFFPSLFGSAPTLSLHSPRNRTMGKADSATSVGKGASGGATAAGTVAARPAGSQVVRKRTPGSASKSRSGGSTAGGGGGKWRFYQEDAPGLRIGPVPVLAMSIAFIVFVFILHVWGKITRG